MNLLEHSAKALLRDAGIAIPQGMVVADPHEAAQAAERLGPVMVKAQVPAGGRARSGGVIRAGTASEAGAAAASLLDRHLGPHVVGQVLVEQLLPINRELYAAVLIHPPARSIRVVFSVLGGVDIEETARSRPGMVHRLDIDPRHNLDRAAARGLVERAGLESSVDSVAATLVRMHDLYRSSDAELLEINPLALTREGGVVALDCKMIVDPAAAPRRPSIAALAAPEPLTELERSARDLGLNFVELDGDIGVLANGAGLTMTTMDVVAHQGGAPGNFLEIGGDAYTKAEAALGLVLAHPGIRSLVVNFCGAFARTDVMADGVTQAWLELSPAIPAFFTVHGTGAEEARRMLVERLGVEPYPTMDQAIEAAIGASRGGSG